MKPRTTNPLRGPPSTLTDVIKCGFFHQIRLLISSGVNLEARDASRRTPIILCAFMEPAEWGASLAMTLIEHGVRGGHRDKYARNALHYACIYEREKLVTILLRASDFNLNHQDKTGNTALHYAVMSGNVNITQMLTKSYQKYKLDVSKVNSRGRSALEEAYHVGHGACAHSIEQLITGKLPAGAALKDVRFADDVTVSPLHLAAQTNARNTLTRPQSSPTVRPMSAAFLTRRDSSSSLASGDDRRSYFRSRSSLNLPVNGYYR